MKALIKKSTGEFIVWFKEFKTISLFPDTTTMELMKDHNPGYDFTDIDLEPVLVIRKDMVPSDEKIANRYPHDAANPQSTSSHINSIGRDACRWVLNELLGQHTDNQEGEG